MTPEETVVVGDFPQAPPKNEDLSVALAVITQWRRILNARLLAILALLGALGMFGLAIYAPDPSRTWAASLYAMGVLWPVIALYLKRG